MYKIYTLGLKAVVKISVENKTFSRINDPNHLSHKCALICILAGIYGRHMCYLKMTTYFKNSHSHVKLSFIDL